MRKTRESCSSCGRNRLVFRDQADDGLCGYCRQLAGRGETGIALTGGRWVRDGLTWKWEEQATAENKDADADTDQPHHTTPCIDCGEERGRGAKYRCRACHLAHVRDQRDNAPIIDPPSRGAGAFTLSEIRRAHRAYNRGQRDPWTVEGERRYSRWSKRQQRAKAVA